MIKNFDTVKAQLSDLAGVINSFKSEAVQLRIIELILGPAQSNDEGNGERPAERITPRTPKARNSGKPREGKTRTPTSGTGAKATLAQLADSDFFNTARTLKDIITHCKHNLARTFKANEFSGKLARMISNGELARKKNTDNQYEYKKP